MRQRLARLPLPFDYIKRRESRFWWALGLNFSLKLRTVETEDLDQVVSIEESSFPDPYPSALFWWFRFRARDGFIVAFEDEVLGYAISEIHQNKGHIVSMAVSPEHRREGVGTALLQESLKRLASSTGEVYLEVRTTNKAALRLYEKFSFTKTGETRHRYYPDGEDAILMRRVLNHSPFDK